MTRPVGEAEWHDRLATAGGRGLIARGGGCGYGDAAQNAGGVVALTTPGAGVSRLTVDNGTVTVDAGVTLGALVRALTPLGWTLPVVPGTGRVTVGGAIAADVHGKNHVHHGTFGAHVRQMSVLTPARGPVTMGPRSDPDAFWATVGGLGLTGVIRQAQLSLVPLGSWLWWCTDTVVGGLEPMLDGLRTAASENAYAVAWIDARRRGRLTGGGIISAARPRLPRRDAPDDGGRILTPRLRLPRLPGLGIGAAPLAATANHARLVGARLRPRRVRPLPEVFFPLDAVPDWPGLHGSRGLVQYQFVVPFGAGLLPPPTPQPRPRPRAKGGTAVWDVDGTLVHSDTLLPFLRRFTGTTRLGAILLGSVARHLTTPDCRNRVKATVLTQVLGGREAAAVDAIARSYVTDTVLHRVRPDCLRRWQWHRHQGHRLVLASASLDVYLRHLAARLGADEVISTRLQTADGRLTGQLATPNCRGPQKAARVRDYLRAHPGGTVWAYANGAADRPLLALADVAVRVRPYRTLPTSGEE